MSWGKDTCYISDILSYCINLVRIKIKGYVEGLKKLETIVSNEPEKLFHKAPAPIVQRMDSSIHWISHYTVDKHYQN